MSYDVDGEYTSDNLISPESALSFFSMLYNCSQDRDSYNEEMLKSILLLTLLRIISRYQWYIDSNNYLYYISIIQAVALEVVLSVIGSCLP